MPVPLQQILEETKSLPDKIHEFLRLNPGMAYTVDELRSALGDGELYFTPMARSDGEAILALFADLAMADRRTEIATRKTGQYKAALLQLTTGGKVQAVLYRGEARYVVASAPLALGAAP